MVRLIVQRCAPNLLRFNPRLVRFLSYKLPDPTWSVEDLELSKQHAPVSDPELRTLARRALLDVDQMGSERRNQLKQDLGNMMHIIEQVSSLEYSHDISVSDADMYDRPRGVVEAPLRDDDSSEEQEKEAKEVWSSMLKHKATTKVGAHEYFSIETKRE